MQDDFVAISTPCSESTQEKTRRHFGLDSFMYLPTINPVLSVIREESYSAVENVSSGVGVVEHPRISDHSSTEGTIEALTRTPALELRSDGVKADLSYPAETERRATHLAGASHGRGVACLGT